MTTQTFSFGDRVVHTAKPEWGIGTISAAASETKNGTACQRLTVRFERAGLKTLSTAYATLALADDSSLPAAADEDEAETSRAWLDSPAGNRHLDQRMAELPEPTRDRFKTPIERLELTYNLYRFTKNGAPLLDWAATQTGLKDPLSRFNRHELEQYFDRYASARDAHLVSLLQEIKKKHPNALQQAMSKAPMNARNALRRFNDIR